MSRKFLASALLLSALGCSGELETGPLEEIARVQQGVSVTVQAEADTYVDSANAAGNLGTQTVLEVDQPSPDPTQQVLVRFTVSGVSGAVTSSKLRLYARNGSPTGPAVHVVSQAWSETGVTWNTRPALGALVQNIGNVAAGAWLEVDVSSVVRGNGTYSFALAPRSTDGLTFDSREGANKPTLLLETGTQTCTLSDKFVPSCGALWGVYVKPPAGNWDWGQAALNLEAKVGRKFDIIHRYHDWGTASNGVFPDAHERMLITSGHIIHVAWESRDYAGGTWLPWASIANGSQDAVIDAAADRVKASPGKFLIDFDHEMDHESRRNRGTDAEFVSAYRRIVDRFRAKGVTNVAWVWTVMGWSGTYARYPNLYPGDAYVDWIGYDPYNFYTCNRSAWKDTATTFGAFYDWMHAPAQMAWHGNKPYLLSEFGGIEDPADPTRKGNWNRGIVAALKKYPEIKGLSWFNSDTSLSGGYCNLFLDSSPDSLAGYIQAGRDPYLNQLH